MTITTSNVNTNAAGGVGRPPRRGVFHALGVMEVEQNWHSAATTAGPIDGDAATKQEYEDSSFGSADDGDPWSDDDDSSSVGSDEELGSGGDGFGAAGGVFDGSAGGFFDACTSWVESSMDAIPRFSSNGTFENYEARAMEQLPWLGRGPAGCPSEDGQTSSAVGGYPEGFPEGSVGRVGNRRRARTKRYLLAGALLLAFAGIVVAVFATNGTKEEVVASAAAPVGSPVGHAAPDTAAAVPVDRPANDHDTAEANEGATELYSIVVHRPAPTGEAPERPVKKPTADADEEVTEIYSTVVHRPAPAGEVPARPERPTKPAADANKGATEIYSTVVHRPAPAGEVPARPERPAKPAAEAVESKEANNDVTEIYSTVVHQPAPTVEASERPAKPAATIDAPAKPAADAKQEEESHRPLAHLVHNAAATTSAARPAKDTTNRPSIDEDVGSVANPHILASRTIPSSAIATTNKGIPDATTGGHIHMSVANEERMSYVRFELASLAETDVVSGATLKLHAVNHHEKNSVSVTVHALPHAGKWKEGAVSYNRPPENREFFFVDSFEVKRMREGDDAHLYEVDVTKAIDPSKKRITFMLMTRSEGRLDFAGRTWKGGEAVPELVVTLST